MKLIHTQKPIGSLKNPLAFALFMCIYGTYFFISQVKVLFFFISWHKDDHVTQLKLGVVKRKSHFFLKNFLLNP